MTKSLDVAAIRAALAKATEEPWGLNGYTIEAIGSYVAETMGPGSLMYADAELIVLLRNNAEALLACAEVLQPSRPATMRKGEYILSMGSYVEQQKQKLVGAERRGATKALRACMLLMQTQTDRTALLGYADAIENGEVDL